MGSSSGDELSQWDVQSNGHDERIFVSVRLRPLNDREIGRNDVSDWECINNSTIIYKNSIAERSMFPAAYTFDRVFGCDTSTKQVYEEGAKEVTLSVVSGINATIFAYGQTSSGKTYTMSGITEHTMADIFDYIDKHNDREFVMKFSAMEIYNEAVRDLLNPESTQLRILDDPEKGTVVEKLTEETLRDWSHLKELLCVCEAQRHIGETSLNEVSSRSHQIIRLTIESSARVFLDAETSSILTASVNFVDLAGSERASQTLSAGSRLKEGCHINRSLLTLGTVIRKLSKGRNVHVPYRDSKLTRILQNSLGGNARTAIICTISPARSHVEQSRNTLLFATCAKQVSVNAQVNVVMSDKALVKQLQKELARLEGELRSLGSASAIPNPAALLREKELLIEKMDKEIQELKNQRDHAQSSVHNLLQSVSEYKVSRSLAEHGQLVVPYMPNTSSLDEYSASDSSEVVDPLRSDATSNPSHFSDIYDSHNSNKTDFDLLDQCEDQFLSNGISPRRVIDELFGPDPSQGWEMTSQKHEEDSEDQCKEVRCIEVEKSSVKSNFKPDAPLSPENFKHDAPISPKNFKPEATLSPKKEVGDLSHVQSDPTCEALKKKIQELQKTIDYLVSSYIMEQSSSSSESDHTSGRRSMSLYRSRSCRAVLMPIASSPLLEKADHTENTLPNHLEKDFPRKPEVDYELKLSGLKSVSSVAKLSGKDQEISLHQKEEKTEMLSDGDVCKIQNRASEINVVAKSEPEHQSGDDLEPKSEIAEAEKLVEDNVPALVQDSLQQSPSNWTLEFESKRRDIIELWDACNVPLIRRTYFFLLFQGDPSDSVYVEVEIRRLSFLKSALTHGSKLVIDGQIFTHETSKSALNGERRMLSKQALRKFSAKEREALYQKWGIGLKTKNRRLQLCNRLWTDTKDMTHINDSAAVVAKLVGFALSSQTPKEMFGLSFSTRSTSRRSFNLRHSMSALP
ncbi:hypothetical protein Vadar_023611 [Vaccinium darrowii]|uniref:Uncharacterized protein n=1 Tax=Vaccinium darrowii TaxID=229202 RepID=A0ACB7Y9W0_9ERIC|nr:hypothetical protein Vadar_023611 [Vaccinium darrowii]